MSVNPLKIQEDMHTEKTTDRNANTPSQKQHDTSNLGIASTSSASFDLVMSQLGIANQHAFNDYQTQQWQEAVIERQQLAVLTCEVDYYQEYLQHYGQQGASFMMVSVALAMKNVCFHSECFLAHFGQNRLVVLIKGGDQNSVQNIAENLCSAVKNTRTEHKHSQVDNIVTISVGFSSDSPLHNDDLRKPG
ncbi:diguanylate cyclase domain-containing protein [Psychromonas sp. KJ10-10]|uniref:diguanylate cyclase domain-containing protein n=1 Tax=Psychromonas sp. KJ10-10 TaxID=3391823 RepID=UPI0039B37CDB